MNHQTAVLVFCKAPVLGQVKTRLAKDIGDQQALHVYQRMLSQNLEIVSQLADVQPMIVTTDISHTFFTPWLKKGFLITAQVNGDLGERLLAAFAQALHPYRQVILIGVDSFDITDQHLQLAIEKMQTHDAVITPVDDGGYILIGLKHLSAQLFEEMQWSTPQVYEQTMRRFEQLGLDVFQLPRLRDVDELADLGSLHKLEMT